MPTITDAAAAHGCAPDRSPQEVQLRHGHHRVEPGHAEPEIIPVDQRGGSQRPQAGERTLSQRNLPAPAHQHNQGQCSQRHQQDLAIAERAAGRGDEHRHHRHNGHSDRGQDSSMVANPPDGAQLGRNGASPGAEREGAGLVGRAPAGSGKDPEDGHQQQHRLEPAKVEGVVEPDERLDNAEGNPGAYRHTEGDERSAHRHHQHPGHGGVAGAGGYERADGVGFLEHGDQSRERTGEGPHNRRHPPWMDAGQSGSIGIGRRGPDGPTPRRPPHPDAERHHRRARSHEQDKLAPLDPYAEPLQLSIPRGGEAMALVLGRRLGQGEDEGLGQLGQPDGGHQQDHSGGGEQAAHHGQLGYSQEGGSGQYRQHHPQPVGRAVADHQVGQYLAGQYPGGAHREVDDPARPVDEDDPEGQQSV